jgi:hypothetical protein
VSSVEDKEYTIMSFLRRIISRLFGRKSKPKGDASIYPMF